MTTYPPARANKKTPPPNFHIGWKGFSGSKGHSEPSLLANILKISRILAGSFFAYCIAFAIQPTNVAYGVVTGTGETELSVTMMTHTITYHANGGSGADYTATAEDGDTISIPSSSWNKPDLVFSHWNTSADDTGDDVFAGDTLSVYDDVNLYAIYAPVMPKTGVEDSHTNRTATLLLFTAALASTYAMRSRGEMDDAL